MEKEHPRPDNVSGEQSTSGMLPEELVADNQVSETSGDYTSETTHTEEIQDTDQFDAPNIYMSEDVDAQATDSVTDSEVIDENEAELLETSEMEDVDQLDEVNQKQSRFQAVKQKLALATDKTKDKLTEAANKLTHKQKWALVIGASALSVGIWAGIASRESNQSQATDDDESNYYHEPFGDIERPISFNLKILDPNYLLAEYHPLIMPNDMDLKYIQVAIITGPNADQLAKEPQWDNITTAVHLVVEAGNNRTPIVVAEATIGSETNTEQQPSSFPASYKDKVSSPSATETIEYNQPPVSSSISVNHIIVRQQLDKASAQQPVYSESSQPTSTSSIPQETSPQEVSVSVSVNNQTPQNSVGPSNTASAAPELSSNLEHLAGNKANWLRAAGIPESDWPYVDYIVTRESNWRHDIWNQQGSSAYGLCQSMRNLWGDTWEDDFMTNPVTQLRWCDNYAHERYGGWQQAAAAWKRQSWW